MSAARSWLSGLGRVRRAPSMLIVVWLTIVAITIPPALTLQSAIESHLGASLEADAAANGVNHTWMEEFRASAYPIARTLRPEVIGFGAVMDNTSALADMSARPGPLLVAGVVWLALLWFLTPGIIFRLAVDRPVRAAAFLARCGACASRLFRFALLSAVIYAALFLSLHVTLFDDLYGLLTRDMTVEWTAFAVRLALYLFFFAIVAAVNLLLDFAKVRMIVEDRHSVFGSIAAGIRFIADRPSIASGVYLLNVLLLLAILIVYRMLAPGAGSAGWTMWVAFLGSQAYIVARLFTKLAFWASEAAAVQARFGAEGQVRLNGDGASHS